jgi:hypothetical protein
MPEVLRLPISNVPAGGDYTAAIALGSAGTQVQVLLDTGSSSLGITPKRYVPDGDTSLTTTTLAQDVVYGTGGWAGPVIKTKVIMGANAATAMDAYVALIDAEYEGFGEADGIMGLAYNGLNQAYNMVSHLRAHAGKKSTYPWPFRVRSSPTGIRRFLALLEKMPEEHLSPYFTELESAGAIANMFAFYTLRSFPNMATANPATDPLNSGWFILGGGPEQADLYEGAFQDVAVVDDRYYNVELLAVQVGDAGETAVAPLPSADALLGSNAIVDSGTNSLTLTGEVYETLIDGLTKLNPAFAGAIKSGSSQGGVAQTNINLNDWPTISFILRGPSGDSVRLSCAPSTYWQFDAGTAGRAVFLIADGGMPLSILGLPLFNNYYTVFDRSEDSAGVIRFATIKR